MSYCLERLFGSSRNERIPLIGTRMTIGRSPESSIQIISTLVSRCHAVLFLEDNQWKIKDVKSINGIYVNDVKLQTEATVALSDNDVISLGPPERTEFRYCYRTCTGETNVSDNERPCKVRKREKFQSIAASCTEKNTESIVALGEDFLIQEGSLHIGAECTVSSDADKEETLPKSQISRDDKLTFSKTNIVSSKNVCENSETDVKKPVEISHITSEGMCPSSSKANSESLKLTVEQLRQLLASKEKEQEELQDKLLRAEAQLIENEYDSKKEDSDCGNKSIQERIKSEVLQQVGDIMETELICGICTELFVEAVTLNCSHTFCKFCIHKWKQKKKICPICRAHIKVETQALVLDNFIEKMVENLSTEMKEHRKNLVEERRNSNPSSTSSSHRNHLENYIVISDIESDGSYDSDFNDSDSSIEGMPWAYYGGYGRCYTCGRRGHWANGCPDM